MLYYYHKGKKERKEKMEKVIRICEITGRMSVVAKNLTTEQAIALVKEESRKDEFATYRRAICG